MPTTTLACRDTCCRPEYEGPEITFQSTSTPKARVDHKCDACGLAIVAGTRYYRRTSLVEGEFATEKMHAPNGECAWDA